MSFKTLYQQSPPELKQIVMGQWKAKQNPLHHPEGNTLKHIIVVTNRAFKQFPDNKDIQLAAYFHDLGKLATYNINPKTGQPTAYGHEEESSKLIDQFKDFIEKQGANPEIVKYIVKNHMKIKPSTWDVMKPSKKDPIINDPNYQELEKFGTIDKGGLLEMQYLLKNKYNMKKQLNEEFRRMQKLAGISIDENQFTLSEVLDNVKDTESAATFIYDELDKFIDSRDMYCPTFAVEEKLEKLLKVIGSKLNISLKLEEKSNPLQTEGTFFINNEEIFDYSNDNDYSNFNMFPDLNFNSGAKKDKFIKNVKNILEKSIKPVSESLLNKAEDIFKNVDKVLNRHRRLLKEDEAKKSKVYDFLYSDEIQQYTGVTSFTTCDGEDWDKVKEYINGKGIDGVTGKQVFLNRNEDVTEEEFDKYYEEWLDYIEDERNMESMNQQDMNW